MSAKHLAREHRFTFGVQWYGGVGAVVFRPLVHNLLGAFKLLGRNNLQFQNHPRTGFTTAEHTRIGDVLQHPSHRRRVPLFAGAGAVAVVVEPGGDTPIKFSTAIFYLFFTLKNEKYDNSTKTFRYFNRLGFKGLLLKIKVIILTF